MKNQKKNENKQVILKTELQKQEEYLQKLKDEGVGFDLVVGDAFVRGMRDIGYKSTGTAMDEIIDNAIEAGAQKILVEFETDKNGKKIESIAIIDDGHGMTPGMLSAAVRWGGTHRENSRTGIGRYGYGLPSASISQGTRFRVYSKLETGNWNSVTVDLKDIKDGKYTQAGHIMAPTAEKAKLPQWIQDAIDKQFSDGSFSHGTIVVWEELDRLSRSTISGLTGQLLEHFGLTYRNYLSNTQIKVGGTSIEPIDPLFTTPGYRHYDYDEEQAQALEPIRIGVKLDGAEERAYVTVRFASFSPTFGMIDKAQKATAKNANPRWHIMNDHRGIIVCRMGRQIDTITRPSKAWKTITNLSSNNDRYWGIEIDFPASLDEEFSVTTSKQGVVMSDRLWEILSQNGVERTIQSLRAMYDDNTAKNKEKSEKGDGPRISEQVMAETGKFKHIVQGETSEEREQASRDAFEREVKRKKDRENKSEQQAREELKEEVASKRYKVTFEEIPGAPFFRSEQIGTQFVVYINRKHSFYSGLYASPDSNVKIRSALELLLFVIGQAEADATGNKEKKLFYTTERLAWSRHLDIAFELLTNSSLFESEHDEADLPGEAA